MSAHRGKTSRLRRDEIEVFIVPFQFLLNKLSDSQNLSKFEESGRMISSPETYWLVRLGSAVRNELNSD